MTREETKKNLPLITACVEGKTTQYYNYEKKEWIDVDEHPNFYYDVKGWVKPEPKYRPFKSKEECWNEMLKHEPFGWVTDGDSNYNISVMDSSLITVEYTWSHSYQNAFESLKFMDGTPFGIKVDE